MSARLITMERERIYYAEKVSFPLPGTNVRTRRQLIAFGVLSSAVLIAIVPLAFVLMAASGVGVIVKGFYLGLIIVGETLVFAATIGWIFPKLRSSLPIVVSDAGIRMPVTALERFLLLKQSLIRPDEIDHIEIRRSREWDSNDSLELVVITRNNRIYRSSAKEPSAILRTARVVSRVWPETHISRTD